MREHASNLYASHDTASPPINHRTQKRSVTHALDKKQRLLKHPSTRTPIHIMIRILATIIVSLLCGVHTSIVYADDDMVIQQHEMRTIYSPNGNYSLAYSGIRYFNNRNNDDSGFLSVQKMTVSDSSSRFVFLPCDPVSIESPGATINQPFSPNGSFLVLPNGRFEGFVIVPLSHNGLEDALHHSFSIHVSFRASASDMTPTPALWHEFVKWENDTTFIFGFGLSGDMYYCSFNLNDCSITRLDGSDFEKKFTLTKSNTTRTAFKKE